MADKHEPASTPVDETPYVIVPVPEHLRKRVLEFVKQLDADADTHGFQLSNEEAGGLGTNCKWTKTEANTYQVVCSDVAE